MSKRNKNNFNGRKVVDCSSNTIFEVYEAGDNVKLKEFKGDDYVYLSEGQFRYGLKIGLFKLLIKYEEERKIALFLAQNRKLDPESAKNLNCMIDTTDDSEAFDALEVLYDKETDKIQVTPLENHILGSIRICSPVLIDRSEFCNLVNSSVKDLSDRVFELTRSTTLSDKKPSNKNQEKPVTKSKKRILILNAHPDDDVLAFGGLLARAKRNGDEVYMHTFCVGGPCSNVSTKERLNELMEVSEFFGVKRSTYDDRELDGLLSTLPNSQITGIIDDLIRDLKPDEVYCSPYSEHTDHKALYEAFMGSARLKEGWMPKLFAVGCYPFSDQLYQTQVGGKIFQPLTEEDFKMKIEGFKMYKSQFKPSPSPLSDESLVHQSKYYGMLCGAPYAELYYQLRYIRSI